MTPERYQKAGEIYHAALSLPPAHRPAFLDRACESDSDLRGEVESLLAAHDRVGQFIEVPAMDVAAALIAIDEASGALTGRIGPYELLSPIARGGMGEVYRARDTTLGRDVALKLPRRLPRVDLDVVRRFEHEARAASSLNHPNIVTIHEIGEAAGRRFIAMELVEGQSLATMIGRPMAPSSLARIGRQLAQALTVAHAAGIVHGDIKPENVMVRSDGYVKVLDFGAARLVSAAQGACTTEDMPATSPGPILGTPPYMSPEQTRGEATTGASDVFACGVVLYELATGRHPFPAKSQPMLWRAITTDDPAPLSRDGLRIPADLERLLLRMLQKHPFARPTAGEVEAALASIAAPHADPDPRTRWHNLPARRTSFIGRSAELAALEPMLLDPDIRLLTLTGPGGTGKTRLALEVGARLASCFDGGVSFVNLAPIAEPGHVLAAVAGAHGVRETAERPLLEVLGERLRSRGSMVLLLDNFEQVAGAVWLVSELLDACPGLTVLVTSRAVLHIHGEHEFPVQPLPVPDVAAPHEQLMQVASVALFVQRASAVQAGLRLTPGEVAAVAEICRRLDGLPLAIELAAARIKMLTPAGVLARIERRLELLTDGARDRLPRQQTLRGAIDWSYDLLPVPERTLFRRLSVFVGGCSLDAIEAVCNTSEDLGPDVASAVAALAGNSLLSQKPSGDGDLRVLMLETLREYARERLDESGEAFAIARAHAAYALVLAEEGSAEMTPDEREAWLRCCDVEHDNLRAAVRHLVATDHPEWGLRLGAALFRFWENREHFTEGRETLAALLATPGAGARTRGRARALYHSGVLADVQQDHGAAERLHREALDIYRQFGDAKGVAATLMGLARQVEVRRGYTEAMALLEESASLWEQLGDNTSADLARSNMAGVAKAEGNLSLARTLLERIIETSEKRNDRAVVASALSGLGDLAASRSDYDLARHYHHKCLVRFREIDDTWGIARALTELANIDLKVEDYSAANGSLSKALRALHALGHQRGVARRLESLSWCAGRQARHFVAVRLAAAAAAIRQRILVPAGPAEQEQIAHAMAEARQLLGQAEYDRAWNEGHTSTMDEILDSLPA
jgi:predicted ATPase/serine/threonine protein kinase